MKKIITLIALALATLTLSAKELAKNPDTGLTLHETLGVYSITGNGQAIILGNEKDAQTFFNNSVKVFTGDALEKLLETKNAKYQLKSDDNGAYLYKVGAGLVKIRYSDAIFFAAYLDGKPIAEWVADKGKKVWKALTE